MRARVGFVHLRFGGAEHGHGDPMASMHKDMMKADSAEAAQEVTARAIFEIFNTGNTEGLEDLVTADVVDHQLPP
ncbi:MAG: hypothetical protein IPL52_06510 [Flavobacteriales bacterium]|nr:hypothetical protein [Flavobacteriales bacterium]